MFIHYLSLAWDQLKKYRLQSAVSIVSLAIGFACFALASMWIKYETTYDAFHKDAENLYAFMYSYNQRKSESVHNEFKSDILQQYPQLEQLSVNRASSIHKLNGVDNAYPLYWKNEWCMTDTNFVSLFGLELIEGTTSFVHNPHEVAISDVIAKRFWKDESPIGKELVTIKQHRAIYEQKRIVSAVFRSWGEHSNYSFDFLSRMEPNSQEATEATGDFYIFAHISPKVNVPELNEQLAKIRIFSREGDGTQEELSVMPITKIRYNTDRYEKEAMTKINHIYLFAIAGCLLIMCGLLNYLTMFVNRLFIRKREMALRTVFGASKWDLMVQFFTEYGLLLVIAMCFGLLTISLSAEWFLTMTELPRDMDYIHRESLIYLLIVMIVSLFISLPVIWYFRRLSLQSSIVGVGALTRYHIFRNVSVTLQIAISIFCIFCTIVFMKQLNTLRSNDIGFEMKNRMVWRDMVYNRDRQEDLVELIHFLKQCPEVDTVFSHSTALYPLMVSTYLTLNPRNNPDLKEPTRVDYVRITQSLIEFYGVKLVTGRWLDDGDIDFYESGNPYPYSRNILINETLAHLMGWEDPLGQTIDDCNVVGVVKDIYNQSPTTPAPPTLYNFYPTAENIENMSYILVKYKPGKRKALMEKLEMHGKERGVDYISKWIDFEENYQYKLKSELNLQKLLNIITTICIMVALFGVWSMIMLTCEQRRKEIAIRKVYGATTKDILDMFFIEYMTLQGIAAIVAFPIGYACMKPWLEQYVVQTEISWWIYVGIFLLVALLVALCVGWRVWKTAKAKPADEIAKGRG